MTLNLIWFVFPSAPDRCVIVEVFKGSGEGGRGSLLSELSDIVITTAVIVIIVIVLETTGGRERKSGV